MEDIATKISLIIALGIAAQWLSWRFHLPAIVLLSVSGILVGPVFGTINPETDFGALLRPVIGLAVAIILFEGGITLNFKEIRETSKAVRRLVFLGAPIAWGLGALSAHYVAGLGWPAAFILSGIFVVTGPTVIMPLLRNAHLEKRTASLLRWEAIIVDPIGALFAVLSFELFLVFGAGNHNHNLSTVLLHFILAMPVGLFGGWYLGKLIAYLFIKGMVPEFLKVPVILVTLLASYVATNHILEEAGLLTVTMMGLAMGNSRLASLAEIKRFKEVITVLLVSSLFVTLTATLKPENLLALNLQDIAYIAILLFLIRPLSVFLSTANTGLSFQERLLTGWIAPRGIVAVAVSGLFGTALLELGNNDGERMVTLTFAVVFITVILHGFSLGPLAKLLGLSSKEKPGLLLVGCNSFSIALAQQLKEADIPVTIADNNFTHLRPARYKGLKTWFGEILSETRDYKLNLHGFSHLLALSDNDAYNALVCTEMAHEFGRSHVLQITAKNDDSSESQSLSFTVGGRRLFKEDLDSNELSQKIRQGFEFQTTLLTEEFDFQAYDAQRKGDYYIICVLKPSGKLVFANAKEKLQTEAGDHIISFVKPVELTK